jgi:hypothetical protein
MATTNGSGPRAGRPSRRTLWIAAAIGGAVIAVGVVLGAVLTREGVGVPSRAEPLPGLLTGPAPWGPNTDDLRARLDRLGKPLVPNVSLRGALHIALSVDGKRIRIPAGVGIPPKSGSVAPLYTATPGGGVDLAPGGARRLGLFFKIWGVRFTRRCLGGYCGKLSVVVNGARVPGDPRSLLLRPGQAIVVSIQR